PSLRALSSSYVLFLPGQHPDRLCCCVPRTRGRGLLVCTTPAPSGFYTLSLHDALPISLEIVLVQLEDRPDLCERRVEGALDAALDRKSTRLNSSHEWISYAAFCL